MAGGERHILGQSHIGKGADQLVGHGEPAARAGVHRRPGNVVSVEANHARTGPQHAGEQPHEGGLAGAVRSYQTQEFPLLYRDVDTANRTHAAER